MLTQSNVLDDTPLSNTGYHAQTEVTPTYSYVNIDYLQGTITLHTLDELEYFIQMVLVYDLTDIPIAWNFDSPLYAGIYWQNNCSTVLGTRAGFNLQSDSTFKVWVSLPGTFFNALGTDRAFRLLGWLVNRCPGFKPTRLDIKIRDYSRIRNPSEILSYCREGCLRSVRSYNYVGGGCSRTGQTSENITVYLGSMKSHKYVRVYDSLPVHGEDAIDWECQMREEYAENAWQMIADILTADMVKDEQLQTYISALSGFVVGAVDFKYPDLENADIRANRLERMEWWQDFIDSFADIGRIKVVPGKKPTTVERTDKWLQKSVMPTLAAKAQGLGGVCFSDYLQKAFQIAESTFKSKHYGLVELYRMFRPQGIVPQIIKDIADMNNQRRYDADMQRRHNNGVIWDGI